MNAKHRKAKLERARAHQQASRKRNGTQEQLTLLRPGSTGEAIYKQTYGPMLPKEPRKRPVPKKRLRGIGRKVRQGIPFWQKQEEDLDD